MRNRVLFLSHITQPQVIARNIAAVVNRYRKWPAIKYLLSITDCTGYNFISGVFYTTI